MTRSLEPMLDFFLREKGELVHINSVRQLALIQDATNTIQMTDEKIIRAATPLHTGDIVDYRYERYLITSQVDRNEQSCRGRMKKCNQWLALNWNGQVRWFDAVVEARTFSTETGKVISMPEGNILITVQDNTDTRGITLSQRFYITHQPFKIVGIDRTMNGIIQLSCTLDSINTAYDDVENNIADRWKYEITHTYALQINQRTIAYVPLNETIPLNVTATDNGNEIANPAITYTSSDPSVISVDQQGRVMGIALGQASITAKLTYHLTVQSTIEIRVVETGTHIYSIAITGNPILKTGQSASYVSHIYDHGVEVFDQSVEWSLQNQDHSTPIMGSITSSSGNSVTIKAGSRGRVNHKALILTATLVSDPSITTEKTISLKNLF
ncbi:Ig domain-containing protein [Paenibacillus terrae HPL-003]|uniref:Ig domain-containing protein n=1 Tax=Paenibacillus terrae (strain HPL-003) TaxID=985665 RepID=G7W205_PAETH|nr:Ig-like domain-containing protein [Paenibacillus terrae]AET59185.1 Ig domain-containing protein [Paenibacillus terrae HPL-003]